MNSKCYVFKALLAGLFVLTTSSFASATDAVGRVVAHCYTEIEDFGRSQLPLNLYDTDPDDSIPPEYVKASGVLTHISSQIKVKLQTTLHFGSGNELELCHGSLSIANAENETQAGGGLSANFDNGAYTCLPVPGNKISMQVFSPLINDPDPDITCALEFKLF